MCCKISIQPLIPRLATTVLLIGQFHKSNDVEDQWYRLLLEEETMVLATFTEEGFILNLKPAISTDIQHIGKRLAAGVYFEIAAKYAEKVGGEIIQHSNIGSCRTPDGNVRLLGSYPSIPLSFDAICPGFQAVLLGSES